MLPNYPICIVARIKTIGSLTRCESAGPVGSSPNSRRHPSPAVIVSFHDCLCRLTGWWLSDKLKNVTNHRCPFIRLEQHCCCAVLRSAPPSLRFDISRLYCQNYTISCLLYWRYLSVCLYIDLCTTFL